MKTLIKFSGRGESITTTFKVVSVTFRLFLKTILLGSTIVVSLFAGSRESDSLALVAIKEANPGNSLSWDYTKSIDTWDGVNLSDNRVKSLKLKNNSLTSLPAEIGNLTNLTMLELRINFFKSLPASIGKLTNLTGLDLRKNSLTSLPAEIGKLTNLTKLEVENNSLTSLPATIGKLTKLTELKLRVNSLTSLPAEIGNLTKLTELGLGNNSLTSLPATIGKLTNLTSLNLADNSLTTLPTEIGNLTNLTGLELRMNSLTSLPATIGNLTNVIGLDLENNSLTTLPPEIGKLTKNLKRLKLQNNSLTSLPTEIGNLTNLVILPLSDNSLTSLPSGIENLTNLIGLSLSNNSLTSIPPWIEKLTKLGRIELENNSLTSLPTEIKNLVNLTRLYANENLLSFSDIEYCKSELNLSFSSIHYSPQDSLQTVVSNDSTFLFVLIGGSDNSYQWYKNGVELTGETSDTLKIEKSSLDTEKYNCRATSSVITDLTLWTTSTLTPEDDAVPILSGPFIKSSKSLFSASLQNRSIAITLSKAESITISLVDLRGRYVMPPVSQTLSAGFHSISIDHKVAQGFYILNIKGDIQNITQKVLIK